MNRLQEIKDLLNNDIEICKYQIEYEDLRKVIDRLKRIDGYTIYRNRCNCGLTKLKHFSYEKDWASDYASC